MFDRSPPELLDRDHAFGGEPLQRLTHTAATRMQLAHDVRFDQALTGDEPPGAYALANPRDDVGGAHALRARVRTRFWFGARLGAFLDHVARRTTNGLRASMMKI